MNADDVLNYGHQTVLQTLEGLDHKHWDTPNVCGVWSVREIVSHLASFEYVLVPVLDSLLDGPPSTPLLDRFRSDPLRYNDDEVASRSSMTPREVFDEYEKIHKQNASQLARIPVEQRRRPGVLPWYGPEYDLEDLLAYSFYGHKREHCAQINVFRDLLKAQEHEDG